MSHSSGTKRGIAKTRAQGVKWGASGKALAQRNRQMATDFAESHHKLIVELMLDGHHDSVKLARELNRLGVPTRKGGKWHPATVVRLLKRAPAIREEVKKIRQADGETHHAMTLSLAKKAKQKSLVG